MPVESRKVTEVQSSPFPQKKPASLTFLEMHSPFFLFSLLMDMGYREVFLCSGQKGASVLIETFYISPVGGSTANWGAMFYYKRQTLQLLPGGDAGMRVSSMEAHFLIF